MADQLVGPSLKPDGGTKGQTLIKSMADQLVGPSLKPRASSDSAPAAGCMADQLVGPSLKLGEGVARHVDEVVWPINWSALH